ncbi:MAG: hypothetical protein K2K72_02700 [Duncaniella sp.]|nr:hypothetical protein [Duncaniella sp.]
MMRLKWMPANVPWILVLALILYLTLAPHPLGEEELPLFPGADKLAHFIMFGTLTGAFIFDRWRFDRPVGVKTALCVALGSALLGVGVELMQNYMELGRTGNDPLDALANAAGAFLAVPVCAWLGWLRHTGSTSQ